MAVQAEPARHRTDLTCLLVAGLVQLFVERQAAQTFAEILFPKVSDLGIRGVLRVVHQAAVGVYHDVASRKRAFHNDLGFSDLFPVLLEHTVCIAHLSLCFFHCKLLHTIADMCL